MYDASEGDGSVGPITNGDFAINAAHESSLMREARAKGGERKEVEGEHGLYDSRSRKIQDTIQPVEVRYEAITGHVAQ